MRLKRPPFFSFICILLVGLLASKPLSAQKKFSLPKIHFGMPHFKPLFKKDSTNKTFNPNHWFKYKKEQPYTKNENAMPIAVGYTDFDENIRDLQLLGKLPTDNSLTIRPYILPKSVTYDSLLKAIDPTLVNNGHLVHKKHFDLQLLPVNYLQKYNSHHPYGWNDGPLSFSKGYQYLVSGGVYMHWRNIHLTLRPEYFHTASDKYETRQTWNFEWGKITPSLNKLILGQSNLRIDFGPISFIGGTNNLWLGPGTYSSLLMSNNAQGFPQLSIMINNPIKSPIGKFQFFLLGGKLTQDSIQGFENKNLTNYGINKDSRYINILNLTYTPNFMPNIFFGFNRVFQRFSNGDNGNFSQNYLMVINGLFRKQYNDDNIPVDQLLSTYVRWLFPNSNSEFYIEYGLNDGSSNLRELLLDLSHASAQIVGFKKRQKLNRNYYLGFNTEIVRMAQTPSYLLRNAGYWYYHGQINEGYTQQNQILGNGSGYGDNLQTISISVSKNSKKFTLNFKHISKNPMALSGNISNLNLGKVKWEDFSYGISSSFKLNKFLINAQVELVNSKNYLWIDEHNVSNIFAFINTIYVW
jgi:hypothetical protein